MGEKTDRPWRRPSIYLQMDRTDSGSTSRPWVSIHFAVSRAGGDEVLVRGGTYGKIKFLSGAITGKGGLGSVPDLGAYEYVPSSAR